jgi:type IV secretory pathway VirJ component
VKTSRRLLLLFSLLCLSLPALPRPAAALPKAVADLPVVEVAAAKTVPPDDTLAVFLSGDGGWASLDRAVSSAIAARGIPVVGINSRKYFWTARTPEQTAADLARLLRAYMAAWKKDQALLIGYSFGADVLPPVTNRLPRDLYARVRRLALIGPSRYATFEVHVADWLGMGDSKGLHVVTEAKKLGGKSLVCLAGEKEEESACPDLQRFAGAKAVLLPGGHHYHGRYNRLADAILK